MGNEKGNPHKAYVPEPEPYYQYSKDPIVDAVVSRVLERSEVGMKTYGKTMEDNNTKSIGQWIAEAQEELMDAVIYLEKVKKTLGIFGALNVKD